MWHKGSAWATVSCSKEWQSRTEESREYRGCTGSEVCSKATPGAAKSSAISCHGCQSQNFIWVIYTVCLIIQHCNRKLCCCWGCSELPVPQGWEVTWKKVNAGAGKWWLICFSRLQHRLLSSPRRLIDPHCQCTRGTEIRCSETMSQNSSIQFELWKSQESIHYAEETETNILATAAIKPLCFTTITSSLLKALWLFGMSDVSIQDVSRLYFVCIWLQKSSLEILLP